MSDTLNGSNSSDSAGKCPVDLETRSLWSLWGSKPANAASVPQTTTTTPASLEEAAKHAQTPHPHQRLPLSTHRLESTIPRSDANNDTPAHQIRVPSNAATNYNNNNNNNANNNNNNNNWVYPSEQQVFNAMKRKGWSGIEEESIPSFLQIHNSVNERSWKQVQDWEQNDNIELSRFEGRPKDLTPKAWLLSTIGICDKPFDRHDWYVVHTDSSEEKRYVLDFYMTDDDQRGNGLPRVEIDVRPALDSPRAFVQRGTAILKETFPGIARELDEQLHTKR